jgi:hypothetical protein
MAVEQIDPGALEGDALRRWYLRSPADIEQERQDAAAQRYQDFFGDGGGVASNPTFDPGPYEADEDVRAVGAEPEQPTGDAAPGFTWVAAGPNRFRSVPVWNGQGRPSHGTDYSDAAVFVSGGAGDLPSDPDNSAPASPSADQQPQGRSAPSPYHPVARPASPLIHVAAHPQRPVSVGGDPQLRSPHPTYANASGQSQIAYGALRAPAPSGQELAELRRRQAAFANAARQIDVHNSWFALPALTPPLAALGLGALGEWASGEVAPEAGQALANFIEKDPYLRVGDNGATRAGRRAHAALKERLIQKPGWKYEPRIEEPGDPPLKPDVGAPQRNPLDPRSRRLMELKPDTPTGRAAAARAVKRYLDATGRKVRPIFYKLEDFI